MLSLKCPSNYIDERKYIYHVVMEEFLGIKCTIDFVDGMEEEVIIEDGNKSIKIADCFFNQPEDMYGLHLDMPQEPLLDYYIQNKEIMDVVCKETLPIIFGKKEYSPEYYYRCDKNTTRIGIDIFGSAFFMLTRYEEFVKKERDNYDRFPATESLANRYGFLERPIINEYLEILWVAIHQLWPNVERKKRHYRLIPTHDVDRPFGTAFLNTYQKIHILIGDLIKRRDIRRFISRIKMMVDIFRKGYVADEDNTFDVIMDISERSGVKSTFFFMTAINKSEYDGNYDINRPEIVDLLKRINARGHNVGIHPSFASYKSYEIIENDVNALKSCLSKIGISFDNIGGRQHYLHWKNPDTWRYYDAIGLKFDTTLGYADHIGFRCGVCYEYPAYDLEKRKMLDLKEYPLIVMDCSGLAEKYMNLSRNDMVTRCVYMKNLCKKYDGNFVILWHNTYFVDSEYRNIYLDILTK